MIDITFPFLVALGALLVSFIFVCSAFAFWYRRGIDFAKHDARLPLATRYDDLKFRVKDLERARDELEMELVEANQVIREAVSERAWMEQNRDLIHEMRREKQELEEVRQDYVKESADLADLRARMDEARVASQKLDFERDDVLAKLEQETAKLFECKRLIESSELTAKQLAERVAALSVQRDERAEEVRVLTEAANAARATKAGLDREAEHLRQEITDLTQRRDELRQERNHIQAGVESLQAERMALEGQTRGLEKQRDGLKDLIETLKDTVPVRGKEVNLESLWEPAVHLSDFKGADSEEDEVRALDGVHEQLTAQGLHFSRRVLNAFHTSLKVAVETPLLVLAGISGTGKSLLPQRYAEAMGMHFLPIAVQPRWDGPQDLLGFLNYLDNTYKATELSRALVQMDPIERGWHGKSIESGRDRMLLVLLDEMNLARVEYYFSEFLSRLEARREIRSLDIDADRRNGEIALDFGRIESGASDDGRILAWKNVLFVGTMNEDESTLALSDKVIDRANVIRFGRPPQRKTDAADLDINGSSNARSSWLPFETWEYWIDKSRERVLPAKVGETIESLNAALDRIGRPFGYRLQRAMEAYVRQYPEEGDVGIDRALADQIEQRILPKLRGVDLADSASATTIRLIQDIVASLGDAPLQEAIERGRSTHGGHLFAWMGVERSLDD